MPSNSKNNKCEPLKKEIDEKTTLGKGSFGVVKEWAANKVVKIEKCNKIEYKNKGFLQDIQDRIRMTQPLVSAGLTVPTFDPIECDNACITFMGKAPGDELAEKLKTLSKENAILIGIRVLKGIGKMHKIVNPKHAHGDLHTGNVMVTENLQFKFIDFAFERKLPLWYDYKFFLESFAKHARNVTTEEVRVMIDKYVPQEYKNKIDL